MRNKNSAILKRINISSLFYPGVVLTSRIQLCHVLMKPVAVASKVGVVVQCINHSPITQEPGVRFQVETMQSHKTAKQTADKGCTIVHIKWRLQVDIPEAQ